MGKRSKGKHGKRPREPKKPSQASSSSSKTLTAPSPRLLASLAVARESRRARGRGWKPELEVERLTRTFENLVDYTGKASLGGTHYYRFTLRSGEGRYYPRVPSGNPGEVIRAWHGTAGHNVGAIILEGLRPGRGGMFGSGVYVGPLGKAMGYARSSKGFLGEDYFEVLFECRVALGHCFQADEAMPAGPGKGYDSCHGKAGHTKSWGGTLRYDEWVVYSPEQVVVERAYVRRLVPTE